MGCGGAGSSVPILQMESGSSFLLRRRKDGLMKIYHPESRWRNSPKGCDLFSGP